MKKILLVAAIASTFMAFAEEGTSNATEVQQIGITAITTSRQSVIVAFSYTGVTADKLVKTTNLTVGDELIAYEGTGFKSWKLAEDSDGKLYWQPPTVVENDEEPKSGDEASTLGQAVGTGIWLRRANDPTEEYTFYIYGKPTDQKTIEVPAEKTMLIGNPYAKKMIPKFSNTAFGDALYIPAANGAFSIYTRNRSNNAWGKSGKTVESLPSIDANTGFWYISKEGATISWMEPTPAE